LGFGALIFLVGAVVFWQDHLGGFLRRNGIWFSLVLFGTLSCLVTMIGFPIMVVSAVVIALAVAVTFAGEKAAEEPQSGQVVSCQRKASSLV
jgi:hypothetical protein